MTDEPVFALYCCITAKFRQRKISLLKYFDAHVRVRQLTERLFWRFNFDVVRNVLAPQQN